MRPVLTLSDAASVAEAAAEIFVATSVAAVETAGRFVVALAGGSTPRPLYELLSRREYGERVPWDRTWVTFGDERAVAPDHEDSNYRMAHEALLSRVPIPAEQVLRIRGELPNASRAALFYEETLRGLYPDEPFPRFDLVLLGMGPDGHTASLFPGTDALDETERWVVGNYVTKLAAWRITLTLPALNAARHVLFLITGRDKAERVAEAFGGLAHSGKLPCERIVPADGAREILVDAEAASAIPD